MRKTILFCLALSVVAVGAEAKEKKTKKIEEK